MDRTPGWLVCAALDPVLAPAGFAPGQRGTDAASSHAGTQVIFCAGHDAFSDTHPRLPQANAQERGEGACVDLVVELAADGTLEALDFEGVSLKETLHAVGFGDAANDLNATCSCRWTSC